MSFSLEVSPGYRDENLLGDSVAYQSSKERQEFDTETNIEQRIVKQ